MSCCRSVTYGVAKEFTKILKPLVGNSPHHINSTHEFCLKNMYFLFQDQFYEQVEGVAMGSPVIVANLYMDYFEKKALSTVPTLRLWQGYVDDTFIIQKEIHKQDFLQHINIVDPAIQFTVESNKEDGAIPLLDTIVTLEVDGNLSITVYRKPTHTDQYLQWDSHHHLLANLVFSKPSPMGAKQYVAILSFSAKRRPTSERH